MYRGFRISGRFLSGYRTIHNTMLRYPDSGNRGTTVKQKLMRRKKGGGVTKYCLAQSYQHQITEKKLCFKTRKCFCSRTFAVLEGQICHGCINHDIVLSPGSELLMWHHHTTSIRQMRLAVFPIRKFSIQILSIFRFKYYRRYSNQILIRIVSIKIDY